MKDRFSSLGIAVSACVLSIVLVCGALWAVRAMGELSEKHRVFKETQSQGDQRAAYDASVRALLRDTAIQRKSLSAVSFGSDPVRLVEEIRGIADTARLSVVIDSVGSVGVHKEDQTLEGFAVSVRAEGTYASLVRFIELLESFPGPLAIEQITLERTEKMWTLSSRVVMYVDRPSIATSTPKTP